MSVPRRKRERLNYYYWQAKVLARISECSPERFCRDRFTYHMYVHLKIDQNLAEIGEFFVLRYNIETND